MIGLLVIIVSILALAGFAAASMRWGVDSRTWTRDGRTMTIVR
jgi:Tfp pilus assembly protein PilV